MIKDPEVDYPGLCKWDYCNYKGPHKREREAGEPKET